MYRRTFTAFSLPALASVYGKSFSVSSRAWQQIVEKNEQEGFPNDKRCLRLAIDSGGCHGFLYKFSFEPISELDPEEDLLVRETDIVGADSEEATGASPPPAVVVDTVSLEKLEQAVLDYHSELKGSAFVVVGNELVDQSCACALSFSIRKKGAPKPAAATAAETSFLQGSDSGNARPITRRSAAAKASS